MGEGIERRRKGVRTRGDIQSSEGEVERPNIVQLNGLLEPLCHLPQPANVLRWG